MKDISERCDDYIQYAEAVKKFQDLDFYKQAKAEIDRLRARLAENEALQAENERLRCIISDIKDWDCDVSGGKGGSAEMALETHSKHSTTSGKPRPYKIERHEFGGGLQVKIGETRKEQARFAEQDAKAFGELADELRAFHWCVDACGHDGQLHLDKAREIARDAIKRLVNYI